mgnify:CR=1 FL=1
MIFNPSKKALKPDIPMENYFSGLITSQNGVQGSWDENDYSSFAVEKFGLKEYLEKVKNFLSSKDNLKNDPALCSKMAFTFIVIYLIYEKETGKINETKLVIKLSNIPRYTHIIDIIKKTHKNTYTDKQLYDLYVKTFVSNI